MRVLGVEAIPLNEYTQLCTCVVSRGSQWLDGSFSFTWRKDDLASLASKLRSNPFYKELTAMIFSGSTSLKGRLNEVYRLIGKPSLLVASVKGGLIEHAGLTLDEALSLLKTCQGPFGLEALRLASSLAPMAKALYIAWQCRTLNI